MNVSFKRKLLVSAALIDSFFIGVGATYLQHSNIPDEVYNVSTHRGGWP